MEQRAGEDIRAHLLMAPRLASHQDPTDLCGTSNGIQVRRQRKVSKSQEREADNCQLLRVYKGHVQKQHMELIEKSGETAEKLSTLISSFNRSKEILSAKKMGRYKAFTLLSVAYSLE